MVLAMCPAPSFDVRRFAEIDSTNAYVLEQARAGAPAGTAALADHQRAGRGRLGRRWEAPPGTGVLLSVLLRPRLEPASWHLATAALALAAIEACEAVAGVVAAAKWPNDLVVGERKLAGVLAEADPSAPGGAPGSAALVVGIGLNVTWPGPEGAGGTSLSAEAGRPIAVSEVAEVLLERFGPWAERLELPDGRRRIADALRERCATIGRRVRITQGDGELVGTAVDVDPDGHLVVETEGGRFPVAAGDVVHLRPE